MSYDRFDFALKFKLYLIQWNSAVLYVNFMLLSIQIVETTFYYASSILFAHRMVGGCVAIMLNSDSVLSLLFVPLFSLVRYAV